MHSISAYWPIVEAYSKRGAWCWFATRAVVSLLRSFGGLPALRVSTGSAIEVVVMAVVVSVLETILRRERSLIGNLAVHPALLAACFALPALAGEAVLRLSIQS